MNRIMTITYWTTTKVIFICIYMLANYVATVTAIQPSKLYI